MNGGTGEFEGGNSDLRFFKGSPENLFYVDSEVMCVIAL